MVVGLFICLIPTIFPSVDPKAKKTTNEADGVSRVMWPIIFMLGFVSVSLSVGKLVTAKAHVSFSLERFETSGFVFLYADGGQFTLSTELIK